MVVVLAVAVVNANANKLTDFFTEAWSQQDGSNDLFSAKELSVDLGGVYNAAGEDAAEVTVGVSYFLTENIGFAVKTFSSYHDEILNKAEVKAILRKPAGNLALYLFGGVGRDVAGSEFYGKVGAGTELRFNAKFGSYVESGYEIRKDTDQQSGPTVEAGVRYTF